jgi:hypothetical protein
MSGIRTHNFSGTFDENEKHCILAMFDLAFVYLLIHLYSTISFIVTFPLPATVNCHFILSNLVLLY